jgi:hypothetical protein
MYTLNHYNKRLGRGHLLVILFKVDAVHQLGAMYATTHIVYTAISCSSASIEQEQQAWKWQAYSIAPNTPSFLRPCGTPS